MIENPALASGLRHEVGPLDDCRGKLDIAEAEIEHLKIALSSARRIGAAVGIIMARRGLTDDAAFAVLSRASQDRNQKLRDIAEHVLLTGDLPG